MLTAILDRLVRATGVPMVGVSVGDPTQKDTWTIQFAPEATAEQQATALAALHAFDVTTVATVTADVEAKDRLSEPFTRALVAFLAAHLKLTEVEVRDELMAGFKSESGKDRLTAPEAAEPFR